MKNKVFSSIYVIFAIFFTICFSIGLPIYIREFYFIQIDNLKIAEKTGVSEQDIKSSYNELMDYLVYPNEEFSTGVFSYSEEGKNHFADCKALFSLNSIVLISSTVGIVFIKTLNKKGKISLLRPKGLTLFSLSGIINLVLFSALGVLAVLDFDKAFTVFHKIFFAGKDNWLFDSRYDEIIKALPEEFFMNCGILIISSVAILSVTYIIYGIATRKKCFE